MKTGCICLRFGLPAPLLFSVFGQLNGQYLIKDNKLWSNTLSPWYHTTNYMSSWVKLDGDTLIGEENYLKVYHSQDELHTTWWYSGAVREDTSGKVYYYYNDHERLLYDFSVEKGDTLKSEDYLIASDCYVLDVDYVDLELFPDSLKRIQISESENGDRIPVTWIEGIGSLHGFPNSLEDIFLIGGVNMLVCVFENDTLKYHNDFFDVCYPLGFPEGIPGKQSAVAELSVHSCGGRIIFDLKQLNLTGSKIEIYSISGSLVGVYQISSSDQLELSSGSLPPGVYLYRVCGNENPIAGKFVVEK